MRSMDLLQRVKVVVGGGLILAAYFIALHLDVVTGIIVHLTAVTISGPNCSSDMTSQADQARECDSTLLPDTFLFV